MALSFPPELKYSKTHEWVRVEGNRAVIGITDYAQDALGDVVYVEYLKPDGTSVEPGTMLEASEQFGTIESVKAVAELICPVSGTVVDVNLAVTDSPEIVNQSPYGDGWMLIVELGNPAEWNDLPDAAAYEQFCGKGGGR